MSIKNFSSVFVISLSLIACSSPHNKNLDTTPVSYTLNSGVEEQLIQAAQSIDKSLSILAMAQEANQPAVLNTAPLVTPEGGMGITANIDWSGPIEPLLDKIAVMSGYKIKVLGSAPQIPIIISISQQKTLVADILKNASLQAGKRATVLVFPANRIIELRYAV